MSNNVTRILLEATADNEYLRIFQTFWIFYKPHVICPEGFIQGDLPQLDTPCHYGCIKNHSTNTGAELSLSIHLLNDHLFGSGTYVNAQFLKR
jgi:hypothetical protein